MDLEAEPANHILPHVQHGLASRGMDQFNRLERLFDDNWQAASGLQALQTDLDGLHCPPRAIVEAYRGPTSLLSIGIIHFAIINTGREDRTRSRFPARIGANNDVLPICTLDNQLAQQG